MARVTNHQKYTKRQQSGTWVHNTIVVFLCMASGYLISHTECLQPQTNPLAPTLLSQITGGQAPKVHTVPLVQFDTSTKYYKTMIDGLVYNFKKSVSRASENLYSLSNVTTSKPIEISSNSAGSQQQHAIIQDIQIDGLSNPKISGVYVNKKNLKLHVTFNYKKIKVFGKCSTNNVQQSIQLKPPGAKVNTQDNKILLEATNWNASWSTNVMSMVGRDHFDMSRVYTTHSPQRLNMNLKDCSPIMFEKLKSALVDRVKVLIDSRLVEIMENVMMSNEEIVAASSIITQSPSRRGKRASEGAPASGSKTLTTRQKVISKDNNDQTKKSKPGVSTKRPNLIKGFIPMVANKQQKKAQTSQATSKLATTTKQADVKQKQSTASPNNKGGTKNKGSPGAELAKARKSAQTRDTRLKKTGTKQKVLKRIKRQTPCQQGEELDEYVDQLFRFGTRIVRAMEPVTLPNTTIELPDYNLQIFLYDGKGTRAYKFKRVKPAWVFCSNETISLGITVEVEELRVAYKYRVISGGTRLLFDGDLEARLSPRAQAQFSQANKDEDSEDPVQQRVDRVRLFRLGRVSVIIRGLGNLTQSLSMIINSYLNDNQEELQPTFRMFESDAVRVINKLLSNVQVPILSVV